MVWPVCGVAVMVMAKDAVGDGMDDINLLRKLRKKLRQIENLEQLSRPLNQDEIIKSLDENIFVQALEVAKTICDVSKKDEIRTQILDLSEEIEILRKNDDKEDHALESPDNPLLEPFEQITISDGKPKTIEVIQTIAEAKISRVNENVSTHKTSLKNDEPKKQKVKPTVSPSCNWKTEIFSVKSLEGHNDLVNCVVADEELIISCSRDTTVKVWNATTAVEVRSLRGHTGSVTCLILLTSDDGHQLLRYLGLEANSRVAITGSVDCMVKIWRVAEGDAVNSFYTYNEINCVGYLPSHRFIVTGTEGGKLEMWNAITSQNLAALTSFGDSLTGIKVSGKKVYTSSSEGFICIWELQEEDLAPVFTSNDLLSSDNVYIPRRIRALELVGDLVYYGDDGVNVKILNCETGKIRKLINHVCEFGSTDAICNTGSEVLYSSYHLDVGYGTINVRSLPSNDYLTTLGDGQSGRFTSIAATRNKCGKLQFVTAGMEMKLWEAIGTKIPRNSDDVDIEFVKTTPVAGLRGKVVNSELESSDLGTSEDEGSDEDWEPGCHTHVPREINNQSFFSWCSIL